MDTPFIPAGLSWLAVLRELHRRGHSDGRIAAELSLAFAPASWSRHDVRNARRRRFSPPLAAVQVRREGGSLQDRRRQRWRSFQVNQGWAHLLPTYNEALTDRPRGQRWTDGHELPPSQVRVLSLLRDDGPLRRRQIALRLRLTSRASRLLIEGGTLSRLVQAGLVLRQGWTYTLAPSARPPRGTRRDTGHERAEKRRQKLLELARKIETGRNPSQN